MSELEIYPVGFDANSEADSFIHAWASQYLKLNERFYLVSRLVNSFIAQEFGKDNSEGVSDILDKLTDNLSVKFRSRYLVPIASMYAYNQGNEEARKYFKLDKDKVTKTKQEIRKTCKNIIRNARKLKNDNK